MNDARIRTGSRAASGRSRRLPSIAILFAMMFASQLALTIFLPAVVAMAADLGTSLARVQLVIPAYLGAFAIMQLVAGPLSDAFGRRPVILGGLALFTVASLACGFADDIRYLLASRFFQAMGACTTIVVGRAIIRDSAEGSAAARALSYLAIALAVGPAVAPFFGGFLVAWFDWQATFFATALVGLGVLSGGVLRFSESLPPTLRHRPNLAAMLRNYAGLVQQRRFVGYSLTISFLTGTFQTFMVAGPIVMIDQMEVSPQLFGFYVMVVPAAFMLASLVSARLSGRLAIDSIIMTACLLAVTGGLIQFATAVSGNSGPLVILGAVLVSNFGTGLAFASCYAQALSAVSPSIAGAASALTGFMHMGWAFTVSLILANLPTIAVTDMGIAQTATTLASATAFFVLARAARQRRV